MAEDEEKQRLLRIKWRFTSKMVDKYLTKEKYNGKEE